MGLLYGTRVKAGDPGELCIHPAVLFILGTVRERVIRTHDHKTTGHTSITAGHQRVCSAVQPDMFHRA